MLYCSENDLGYKDLNDLNKQFTTGNFVEKYLDLKL